MSHVVIAWQIQSLCSKSFILRPPFRSCPNNLLSIEVHHCGLIQILSLVAFCSQSLLWTPQNNKRVCECMQRLLLMFPSRYLWYNHTCYQYLITHPLQERADDKSEDFTPLLLTELRINIRVVHVSSSGIFHRLSAKWFIVMGFCCIYLCYYLLLLLFKNYHSFWQSLLVL